ncbi:DNA polymerase III subunit beta family protein [Nocardia callitridis]|uniref:MerR family transcriptional regulator n=1 Tax=Nocardia callitridis TaxID=648753 RepID=A0ABP9KDD8_9NOCA
MTETEPATLITIGVLAKASGLTVSALRFYDDCGLLTPTRVDPITGYRYYTDEQCRRADLIRRLRTIEVPLDQISAILTEDTAHAHQLLDEHVERLELRAREAIQTAESIKHELAARPSGDYVALSGHLLAEAIRQVRSAAATDPEIPVLTGVSVVVSTNSTTVAATDRYRLSTRTLVPRDHRGDWALVLDPRDLDTVIDLLTDTDEVVAAPAPDGLHLAVAAHADYRCRTIPEQFPDLDTLLAGLAPVSTRVVIDRNALLAGLESDYTSVSFAITQEGLAIAGTDRATQHLSAAVTGDDLTLHFNPHLLRPAIETALGPDIMLDLSTPAQPLTLRSATDGDLTTLVMPIKHE